MPNTASPPASRRKPTPTKGRAIKVEPLKIDDPIRFLIDNGLWFYINQRVLHPIGLSAVAEEDARTGRLYLAEIIDRRESPDQKFTKKELIEGERKLRAFMERAGSAIMDKRERMLKFVVQRAPKEG